MPTSKPLAGKSKKSVHSEIEDMFDAHSPSPGLDDFLDDHPADNPPKTETEKVLDVVLEDIEDEQRCTERCTDGLSEISCAEDDSMGRVTRSLSRKPPLCFPGMGKSGILGAFRSLQGRVLTIIDSCFSDKVQREATKTL